MALIDRTGSINKNGKKSDVLINTNFDFSNNFLC